MTERKPIVPAIQLITLKGVKMRQKLMIALGKLEGPAEEDCAVTVSDGLSTPGVSVAVQRSVPVVLDKGWGMQIDHEALPPVYIYRRQFESESEEDIARAIQCLLDLPGIPSFLSPLGPEYQ